MTTIDETRKCVYCLKDKRFALGKNKSESEFNVEHVINQAFGTADGANPTLVGRVCKECNSHFSKTIDIAVTKDSFEAFMRVSHNMKNAADMTGKTSRRLSVKYTDSDGKEQKLSVDPAPAKSGSPIAARPVVEVTVREDETTERVEESQLDAMTREELLQKYDLTKGTKITGTVEDSQRILKIFDSKGINIKESTSIPLENARQEIVIDETLQRAFAKISFNYMVHCCEKLCPELPYLECFNSARKFIVDGIESGGYRVVNPWAWPVLDPPPKEFKNPGHLLTLEYGRDELENLCVVGKLSLFKEYAVRITLSRTLNAEFCRFDGGHYSDLTDKKVLKLSDETMDRLRGEQRKGTQE